MIGIGMELLLLHALPLDGTMWAKQMDLLPGATHAPTLYDFGDNIGSWAENALSLTTAKRLVVVGCSVGGSCALEVIALAPERVHALILIGTKAWRRRDLAYHSSVLQMLYEEGLEFAWQKSWSPLLSRAASPETIERTKKIALRQSLEDVARGVRVFHTRPSRDEVLSSFSGPVAIITGSEDTAPGIEISRKQAVMARNGLLYVVPECGHYVPIEQPEVLNSIIRQTLETA